MLSHGHPTLLPLGIMDKVLGGDKSHLWAGSEPLWCVLAAQLLGGVGSVEALSNPGISRDLGLSHCLRCPTPAAEAQLRQCHHMGTA